MNDQSVKHLSNCPDVTLEKYRHWPVIVRGHLVQEPPARLRGAVQLLGQHLHPLHDVELLLGVDEGLQEERGGQSRNSSVIDLTECSWQVSYLADISVMSSTAPSDSLFRVVGRN